MSYSDFLESLTPAFNLFLSTLSRWAENLLTNYFYITLIGLALFVSLVIFLADFIQEKLSDHFMEKANKDDFSSVPTPQIATSSELHK